MNRRFIINKLLSCLKESDIAVISKELSKEAFTSDRSGNFYNLNTEGILSSLGFGIAMNTDRRVFVFMTDGDFLKEVGSFIQVAVGRCKNMFLVILCSGTYQSSGGQPTVFKEIYAPKGMFFNFGFLVNDYTHYCKNKTSSKILPKLFDRVRGPMVIIINVDITNKAVGYLEDVNISEVEIKDRIIDFLLNKSLETFLYNPPHFLDQGELNTKEE